MRVGSDFSGVGAFEQALKRLKVDYNTIFACDMDKYARQTYIENNGEPEYFPEDVYDRDIPAEPLDIYMTSPPCQAFSLAGKRKGEQDNRGVLFYNSHEFIKTNRPRYFIFENVKGLLSDDGGKTFQRWIDYLAKSVNGQPVIFPHDQSVMYHVYYKVLNSKDFGVPQNRERIFIIGIRDDKDNDFRFPKEEHLAKKLKDVLESEVNDKYYLSEKAIKWVKKKEGVYTGFNESPTRCLTTRYAASLVGTFLKTENSQAIEMKQYGDKRLTKTINDNINEFQKGTPIAIDNYNQSISNKIAPTVKLPHNDRFMFDGAKIRRLTPRECFRLQDFPDSFTWTCSDSQAYKQAGNSITIGVLEKLLNNLLHL